MTAGDCKKLIEYWLSGSEIDWKTHESLVRSKHYGPSLFYLHLSLEKLIKALVVKGTKAQAPFNDNLVFLIGKTSIKVSNQMIDDLSKMTEFNMNTRYPPDIERFYKSITRDHVKLWQQKAKVIRLYILETLNEKSER